MEDLGRHRIGMGRRIPPDRALRLEQDGLLVLPWMYRSIDSIKRHYVQHGCKRRSGALPCRGSMHIRCHTPQWSPSCTRESHAACATGLNCGTGSPMLLHSLALHSAGVASEVGLFKEGGRLISFIYPAQVGSRQPDAARGVAAKTAQQLGAWLTSRECAPPCLSTPAEQGVGGGRLSCWRVRTQYCICLLFCRTRTWWRRCRRRR